MHPQTVGDHTDLVSEFLQKVVLRLLAKCSYSTGEGKAISQKRREKFARYDNQIERYRYPRSAQGLDVNEWQMRRGHTVTTKIRGSTTSGISQDTQEIQGWSTSVAEKDED